MKRILIAALLGATLVVSAEVQRDTAVVVLSFISPVAREALDSYDYRNCKNAPNESRNFPLPLVPMKPTNSPRLTVALIPLRTGTRRSAVI